MKSCLYECRLTHARVAPQVHAFAYRIFLFAIDLDELAMLDRQVPLFSLNRSNLYSFRENDYLPTDAPLFTGSSERSARPSPPASNHRAPSSAASLKARVTTYLASRGVDLRGGRVVLVTLPRIAGYLFNPVSFFFCYDREGNAVAAIAEVTNTFREMKPYFLPRASGNDSPTTFRLRVPKYFYVSPFSDVDVEFDFALAAPDERLTVCVDEYVENARVFRSGLHGDRRELTSARLVWLTIKYPLLTLRIISLIHWHAFLLWLKRAPWFRKAARAADQRELYRPHASIA